MHLRLPLLLLCLVGLTGAVHPAVDGATGTHPCLLLTPAEVGTIKAALGKAPLFDAALAQARQQMETALAAPIAVPVPQDAAGYTHERHKQNYSDMKLAGVLYQLTGDRRYAGFVKEMLTKYAALYPTLGRHPASRNASSSGRLFWQLLNESVWLVNVSQAYDCIHDSLSPEERALFESKLFRPMARFIAEDHTEETFDRIHNHGTWAVAAVGMIGYVMGDATLVKKALHGSAMDGTAGYFRQMDGLFSPDGYYCEGPYYARYALLPFYLMAQAIANNQPELNVFERRDGVLRKALYAMLQQSGPGGVFFPINDALKDKADDSLEVVTVLDLAYRQYGRDAQLLAVARRQQAVELNAAGLEVAQALAATADPVPFAYRSMEFRDGPGGDEGGLGVLRTGKGGDEALAILKYTALGMGHGHLDKLALLYYDQDREIISDYGAARFLNVEQKYGGRYLPENGTFAKQTIAHNTVVVDRRSHYRGSHAAAAKLHSERHFFAADNPDFQVVSARDVTAVPGVGMQRTIALVRDPRLAYPVVLDVFRVVAGEEHDYDLPFYYQGHLLGTNARLTTHATARRPLGTGDGYEHLWLEAEGPAPGFLQFTWLNGSRYYTISTAADPATQLQLVRIGANDPNFNLRNEPAFILHRRARSHVFASVIEPHGQWDGRLETTSGGSPRIRDVRVLAATDEGTVVEVAGEGGLAWTLLISNRPAGLGGPHRIEAGGTVFAWDGNAVLRTR